MSASEYNVMKDVLILTHDNGFKIELTREQCIAIVQHAAGAYTNATESKPVNKTLRDIVQLRTEYKIDSDQYNLLSAIIYRIESYERLVTSQTKEMCLLKDKLKVAEKTTVEQPTDANTELKILDLMVDDKSINPAVSQAVRFALYSIDKLSKANGRMQIKSHRDSETITMMQGQIDRIGHIKKEYEEKINNLEDNIKRCKIRDSDYEQIVKDKNKRIEDMEKDVDGLQRDIKYLNVKLKAFYDAVTINHKDNTIAAVDMNKLTTAVNML